MAQVRHAVIDDEELYMNGLAPEPVAIHLGGGQEWDDTVLIRGWEAAKEEFHLHHPGPGSWLDKATAALSVGNALSGAKFGDSEWYSATQPTPSSSWTTAAAQADRTRYSKRKADQAPAASSTSNKRTRVQSPTFTPLSPSQQVGAELEQDFEQEREEEDGEEEEYEIEIENDPAMSGSYPAAYTADASPPASMQDALQKSMQAQWWAGYWYGYYASRASAAAPAAPPAWNQSPYGAVPKKPTNRAHKARRAAKTAAWEAKKSEGEGEEAAQAQAPPSSVLKR